jgi:four helix bundle protein
MEQKEYNLEDRLINYTCTMIDIVEALPNSRAGIYIAGQLIRSCHSPSFNYGEVQGAESRNDFIHKMSIVLKELKECRVH